MLTFSTVQCPENFGRTVWRISTARPDFTSFARLMPLLYFTQSVIRSLVSHRSALVNQVDHSDLPWDHIRQSVTDQALLYFAVQSRHFAALRSYLLRCKNTATSLRSELSVSVTISLTKYSYSCRDSVLLWCCRGSDRDQSSKTLSPLGSSTPVNEL